MTTTQIFSNGLESLESEDEKFSDDYAIRLGIVGLLSEVGISRKYPMILKTKLSRFFKLTAGVDIYKNSVIKNYSNLNKLFGIIKKHRLRKSVDAWFEELFLRQICSETNYFGIGAGETQLPQEFLENTDVIDISTPNKYHFPMLKQVLDYMPKNKECFVIVEKPIVGSKSEVESLENIIKSNKIDSRRVIGNDHYLHYGNIRHYVKNLDKLVEKLGKINDMKLLIKEKEGFDNSRNRDTIYKPLSCGGIWLDMGIHALGFLTAIGAEVDYQSDLISAWSFKSIELAIRDDNYGESGMVTKFKVRSSRNFSEDCYSTIHVEKNKDLLQTEKIFMIRHEMGSVEIDIKKRDFVVLNKNGGTIYTKGFMIDPYYSMYYDLIRTVIGKKSPYLGINNTLKSLNTVFDIYDFAENVERNKVPFKDLELLAN